MSVPSTTLEIRQWLRKSIRRIVRVELDYMYQVGVGDSAVPTLGTLYLSNAPYVDDGSSPLQAYTDCVRSIPRFERSIDRPTLRGAYKSSVGTLVLDNTDGGIDYILDLPIDGSDVRIYVGEDTWNASEFIHLFTAVSVRASSPAPGDFIEIELRDTSLLLNQQIGGDIAVGSPAGSPSSPGPAANKFRPYNFGWVHNIEAILLDSANLIYVHSDTGTNTAVQAVRDNGVDLGGSPSWSDNGDGTFTLAASPAGQVTCDVLATNPLSTASEIGYRLSDALEQIVGQKAGLSALGKYLGPQYASLEDGLNDYPMGVSIADKRNVIDVLDDLMQTRNGVWAVDRTGMFYYTVMRPDALSVVVGPDYLSVTPTEIAEDDVDYGSIRIDHASAAYATYQCYSNKNWLQQTQFAGSVSQSDREKFGRKGYFSAAFVGEEPSSTQYLGSSQPYLGGAPQLYHLTMTGTEVVETLISGASDTAYPVPVAPQDVYNIDSFTGAWIAVRRAQHLPWTEFIDISVGLEFYTLEIGHVVNFTYPRYGLDGGVLFQVASVNIDVANEHVELGLVRRRFAGLSGPLSNKLLQENGDFILQETGDYILI